MLVIVLYNANATDTLAKKIENSGVLVFRHAFRERRRPYLEDLDENEDLGVVEVDRPSARNARDDGVNEQLPG
jgi:hypothetical protein